MDKALIILAIGDLIVTHGVPAAIKMIQTLNADAATLADLRALRDQGLRPAAEYFNDANGGAAGADDDR